jgi:hypothetical protein
MKFIIYHLLHCKIHRSSFIIHHYIILVYEKIKIVLLSATPQYFEL